MDHRLHKYCNSGCERQGNWVSERPTWASIALDRLSDLNYELKLFFYIETITSVENYIIILHILM
jgi:hypothetical protein